MSKFKQFVEGTGVISQDFSHLSKDERLKQGKDAGEKFIINELAKHGVRIVTVQNSINMDTKLKIDGYLNGSPSEPVQIKLRKTSRDGKDDIAYELVLGYNTMIPVEEQLKNPHRQGRDYKGTTVKHYFVMNQNETCIYHVPASSLKSAAMQAVQESAGTPVVRNNPFVSSIGVELRATSDNSSGIDKLMAFIPVDKVAQQKYMVGQGKIQPTLGTNTIAKKDFNVAAADDRLARLQAKQKLVRELRQKGFKGIRDDDVINAARQAGVSIP